MAKNAKLWELHVLSFAPCCSPAVISWFHDVPSWEFLFNNFTEESLGAAGPDGHEVRLIQRGVRWHHDCSPWHLGCVANNNGNSKECWSQRGAKFIKVGYPMLFNMIHVKKIVGIRWNPPNAHRVGSGVGAYRRILEGIDPPRLMQAREEMLCLAFGVARWISENVWDGLWWFIYIYINYKIIYI